MYLTKLLIPLESRRAAEVLSDCQKMHRLVCSLFGTERKEEHILYRINVLRGSIQVYLYSDHSVKNLPEGIGLEGQRDLSEWLDAMTAGDSFGFDLLTCPSKKVYQPERNQNSQRRILREPQERMDWLNKKATDGGFRLLDARELEQSHPYGRHNDKKGGFLHLDAYHYQGALCITDPDRFRKTLREGIGPGKAYGLGMMMVKTL